MKKIGKDREPLFVVRSNLAVKTLHISGARIGKRPLITPDGRGVYFAGPGSHGGNNVGYDGKIYTAQHGGAGGGPGRMFSIAPETGEITIMQSSLFPETRPSTHD